MKSLKNITASVDNGKVTIIADIEERSYHFPCQQVTVRHVADTDPRWSRHAQLSNEAFFVKRRQFGVAFPLEEMITKVASLIEPNLAYLGTLKTPPPTPNQIVAELDSELPVYYQWKIADKIDAKPEEFNDIEGATSPQLNREGLPANKFVRCVAKTGDGVFWTPPTISK